MRPGWAGCTAASAWSSKSCWRSNTAWLSVISCKSSAAALSSAQALPGNCQAISRLAPVSASTSTARDERVDNQPALRRQAIAASHSHSSTDNHRPPSALRPTGSRSNAPSHTSKLCTAFKARPATHHSSSQFSNGAGLRASANAAMPTTVATAANDASQLAHWKLAAPGSASRSRPSWASTTSASTHSACQRVAQGRWASTRSSNAARQPWNNH